MEPEGSLPCSQESSPHHRELFAVGYADFIKSGMYVPTNSYALSFIFDILWYIRYHYMYENTSILYIYLFILIL
jgi:hypothetical protein